MPPPRTNAAQMCPQTNSTRAPASTPIQQKVTFSKPLRALNSNSWIRLPSRLWNRQRKAISLLFMKGLRPLTKRSHSRTTSTRWAGPSPSRIVCKATDDRRPSSMLKATRMKSWIKPLEKRKTPSTLPSKSTNLSPFKFVAHLETPFSPRKKALLRNISSRLSRPISLEFPLQSTTTNVSWKFHLVKWVDLWLLWDRRLKDSSL